MQLIPPPAAVTRYCALLVSALSLSFGSALAAQNPLANKAANEPAPVVKADKPIKDSQGRIRYIVDLVDEDAAELARAPKPDSIRSVRDAIDYRKNASKARIDDVAKVKGVELHSATHLVGSSFTAYLTEKQVDQFAKDKRIKLLTQDRLISPSALWNDDYNPWGQERSWGNYAMGAQHVWGSNGTANVYVLDSGVEWHPDLNVVEWLAVPGANASGCYPHATHVAGIIGAHNNGFGTVGVLPSARIVSIAIGDYSTSTCVTPSPGATASSIVHALDMVYARVWSAGTAAVVNLSFNLGSNTFAWWGSIGAKIQAVATPMNYWNLGYTYKGALFVQSAGNDYADACAYAYNGTSAYDGILVVGGFGRTGQPIVPLASGPGFHALPYAGDSEGSNFGGCVEIWAPSQRIKSTWKGGSYQRISGTSMAAPHVAGLAAWLLEMNTQQTAIDLESAVRTHIAYVGGSNLPFAQVYPQSYLAQPTTEIHYIYQGTELYASDAPITTINGLGNSILFFGGAHGANSCSITRISNGNTTVIPVSPSANFVIQVNGLVAGFYQWALSCSTVNGTTSSVYASGVIQ